MLKYYHWDVTGAIELTHFNYILYKIKQILYYEMNLKIPRQLVCLRLNVNLLSYDMLYASQLKLSSVNTHKMGHTTCTDVL